MNNPLPAIKAEQKTDNLILLVIALAAVALHILLNGQYGFHRDELDFLFNARHLDWGYISYPPITPFFARIGLALFGESLRGLRVLPAIAQGIVIVLAGLMARDLGGKRAAQVLAALAVFIAPVSLMGGTLIMYFAFDYLWWALGAFFFIRLLARDEPRYWLGIGAAIGLGMLTKYTMAFWVAGLAVGVLATAARKYLRSQWLYLGAGLALLIFLPNLLWQVRHGFHLAGISRLDPRPGHLLGPGGQLPGGPTVHDDQPLLPAAVDRRAGGMPVRRLDETFPRAGLDVPGHLRAVPDHPRPRLLHRPRLCAAARRGSRLVRGLAGEPVRERAPDRHRPAVGLAGDRRAGRHRPDQADRADQLAALGDHLGCERGSGRDGGLAGTDRAGGQTSTGPCRNPKEGARRSWRATMARRARWTCMESRPACLP